MRMLLMVSIFFLVLNNSSFAVDEEGLLLYYPFEGGVVDESGNNNNPKTVNSSVSRGLFGDAALFDGIDDEIHIPSVLNGEVNSFTIEMWVLWRPLPGTNDLLPGIIFSQLNLEDVFDSNNQQNGREISRLEIHMNSTIQAYQEYKVNLDDISSLLSFPLFNIPFVNVAEQPVWYHLALVSDVTRLKTYVNGRFITTGGRLPHSFGTIEWILGGGHLQGPFLDNRAPHFSGVIDEFRVWDHARTEDQILANMKISLLEREQSLPLPTPTPLPERIAFEVLSQDFNSHMLYQIDSELKTRTENWIRGKNNDLLVIERNQSGDQIVWHQTGAKTIIAATSKREKILGLYPINENSVWVILQDLDHSTWNIYELSGSFHPANVENFMQF